MTDLNQTALAAAKEVRGIASTEGIIRAYLDALPAAPLPADVERLVAELRSTPRCQCAGYEEIPITQRAAALLTQQAQALADANARIREMEEALEPFSTFAKNNTDDDGWAGLRCERERIYVWFGPSDFIKARRARGGNNAE